MLQPVESVRGRFLSRARLDPAPLGRRPTSWRSRAARHLRLGGVAGMAALLLAALWGPLADIPSALVARASVPLVPGVPARFAGVRHVSLPARPAAVAVASAPGSSGAIAPHAPSAPADLAPPVAALEDPGRGMNGALAVAPPSIAAAPAIVAAPASFWPDSALAAAVRQAIPDDIGRVAVSVRQLRSGASADVDAALVMPPASLYKLGVLVVAFREIEAGRLSLNEWLPITEDDWLPGAGVLQARIGEMVTVTEALRLMTGISDNTAASVLMHRVGVDAMNEAYAQEGLANTRFYPDWRPDTTTAAETARLLADLATGQLAGPAATQQMLDLLAQEQPSAWIEAALPAEDVVAHKSGQLVGVRNDAAIVFGRGGPYVLTILIDDLDDDAEGEAVIGAVAAAVDGYFRAPAAGAVDTLAAHLVP